jgi:heat shock protein HslJ
MKTISILFCILLLVSGCERAPENRDFSDDPSIPNISGTWVVVSYEDFVNNSVIKKSDVDSWNGMDVILTFTKDSLYGRNTTNSVTGNFTLSDRTIHIIRYGGTKLGQPEWGNMFSDVVHGLQTFKINENQLRFFYNNNKNSVTLKPN